jgi:membrane protein implicated in regulation of membrane protease activity
MPFDIPLWIIWLIAAIVFFIGEVVTDGFCLLWFSVGALVALFFTLFTDNIIVLFAIFLAVAMILLISTRKLTENFLNSRKKVESNVNALIGKKAKIIEEIDQIEGFGKVKVNGEVWKAITEDSSTTFDVGETVVIKAIDGVKLIISKE